MTDTIKVPHEIIMMIESRRAAFEYNVIANLLEMEKLTNKQIVEYLRNGALIFTKMHDEYQARYAERNKNDTQN